ncbi:lipase 3 [Plutella xylostella]|uniref:lipase 3 n=1 Tax=Plutella xylostella TaxID=51655 RepID=UPI00203300B9|nr:lipase 3 [Plutella xylostella]
MLDYGGAARVDMRAAVIAVLCACVGPGGAQLGGALAGGGARLLQGALSALTTLDLGLPALLDTNTVDMADQIISQFGDTTNEDARLDIVALLTKYGQRVETHSVRTGDGYLLRMFRVPGNGSAVLLMHGLLGSADDFVLAGARRGLAYRLAAAGHDVWLGNARGNKHSRRHATMRPADPAFWDFSWHEIGTRDLPAMIDHVLRTTGRRRLKYVGHSQGTTSFFVMAAERPEYNDKVALMVALSPVAFMSRARSPVVRLLARGGPLLQGAAAALGLHEFLPDSPLVRALRRLACGLGALAERVCGNALFLATGFGFDQLDVGNLPVLLGHTPSGASMKQFVHYGQGVLSGDFRQFDYGADGNLEKYGTEVPPSYRLDRITAPVSLFYSDADWLAHPDDVDELYNKLDNCIDIHKIPHSQFNHIDFLFGKDCNQLVNNRLSELLENF